MFLIELRLIVNEHEVFPNGEIGPIIQQHQFTVGAKGRSKLGALAEVMEAAHKTVDMLQGPIRKEDS